MVDGGAAAKSMSEDASGIAGQKGVAAEGSANSTVLMPGSSENIRRTVAEMRSAVSDEDPRGQSLVMKQHLLCS